MNSRLLLFVLFLFTALALFAADLTGTWTTSFDSPVGQQTYTYMFKVTGTQLTGRAKNNLGGDTEITEGKVQGDTVSFVENFDFQGMPLKITYTGKIVSDDEIKFTRNVADFGNEEIVAKRSK